MKVLYIVLIVLAVLLFIVGFVVGIIQKREAMKKVLFNTNTKAIEVLDDDTNKPKKIEKPMIISSTLIEEDLDEEKEK